MKLIRSLRLLSLLENQKAGIEHLLKWNDIRISIIPSLHLFYFLPYFAKIPSNTSSVRL